VLRHEAYDFRVDWWALGVIAFVFFAGRYPFNKGHGQINNDRSEEDRMVMYNRIVDGIVEFPDDIPAVAADVIREVGSE
jgi:serine/threonine protein kinase